MKQKPLRTLAPLLAAILVHVAVLLVAVALWRTVPAPLTISRPATVPAPPTIVFLLPTPATRSVPDAPPRSREQAAAPAARADSGGPAPLAATQPSTGDASPAAPAEAGAGWGYRPTLPSSRFTEATLRSVMADLPPRPNCALEQLKTFHCAQLLSRWSLDSGYRVNLNCVRISLARERYAECVQHPMVVLDTSPRASANEGPAAE